MCMHVLRSATGTSHVEKHVIGKPVIRRYIRSVIHFDTVV